MKWTRENTDKLKALKAAGKSNADIALELDTTLRAIQARLARLKSNPIIPRKRRPEATDAPALESVTPLRLDQLRSGQCRWPLGLFAEKAEIFCAARTKGHRSYCPYHLHRSLKVNEHANKAIEG